MIRKGATIGLLLIAVLSLGAASPASADWNCYNSAVVPVTCDSHSWIWTPCEVGSYLCTFNWALLQQFLQECCEDSSTSLAFHNCMITKGGWLCSVTSLGPQPD